MNMRMSETWRIRMFWLGAVLTGFTLIATLLTWAAPVPLIRVNDGFTDVNSYFAFLALPSALVSAVLGSYGRGSPRVLVVSISLVLFVLAYIGLLSQGH